MLARMHSVFLGFLAALILFVSGCDTAGGGHSATPAVPLSSLSFSNMQLQFLSYGQSSAAFSFSRKHIAPKSIGIANVPTSYFAAILFDLGSSTTTILGFDVYRSSDGTNFTKIATQNYGELSSTQSLSGPFEYDDYDATLVLGTTYYYKVQAFDASGTYSVVSPIVSAAFLTPFTVSLTSPGTGSTVASPTPIFTFTLSDATNWSPSVSDFFYFSLFVKDENGNPAYYGEFRYSFAAGLWQIPGDYDPTTGLSDWSHGFNLTSGVSFNQVTKAVSVDFSQSGVAGNNDAYVKQNFGSFSLLHGHAYEWDIFGDWQGTSVDDIGTYDAMDPAYFVKANSSSSASGYGVSYANTYAHGEGSINGAFEFNY